jgi:hypothetical protein
MAMADDDAYAALSDLSDPNEATVQEVRRLRMAGAI